MTEKMGKEIVLYALDYAKQIIDFYGSMVPKGCPAPPMDCINKTIRMIKEGKLPWEE